MKKPTPKEMEMGVLSKEEFEKKYPICGTARKAMDELAKKKKK